jgi:hypothetical protein
MILRARIKVTKPYKGSTKFEFFKNLKANTVVKIEVELKDPGSSRGKMYSPTIIFSYKEKDSGELKIFQTTWNKAVTYIKNMMVE